MAAQMTHHEISGVTKNFRNKLATGGFSTVYRGTIQRNSVAVKKFTANNNNLWQNEMQYLTRLNHDNIINLIAYGDTDDGGHFLVFEQLKTIEDTLKGLEWPCIRNILIGAARGLNHIHQLHLVMGDFKADNVLLDKDNNPKITDFGTMAAEGSQVVTSTSTYAARELMGDFSVRSTTKQDVFSYGVFLLELVYKKRNKASDSRSSHHIVQRGSDDVKNLKDPIKIDEKLLRTGCTQEDARKILNIGLQCCSEDASKRPTMTQVIGLLEELINNSTDKSNAKSKGKEKGKSKR